MAGLQTLNPKAEHAKQEVALEVTCSAAQGVQQVIKSNLGPKGTLKMLVSGAGDIKLTKDGCILLNEMQFQNPIASMIGKMATAQDDQTGDGTTSNIIIIGELMRKAQECIHEGIHPRIVTEGFQLSSKKALEILEELAISTENNKEMLMNVARTALRTKLKPALADKMTEIIVDAVLAIQKDEKEPVDLHMVEMQEMTHKTAQETQLIKGLVLDHGARHPDMPKSMTNCYILTGNVSLEYEKTEVNSGFFYKTAEERQKLVDEERRFIDDRVRKVIELKKKVCEKDPKASFVLVNQKGIDPVSLDMLAKEKIFAVRRAKRRNMERLMLACGGTAMNSWQDSWNFISFLYIIFFDIQNLVLFEELDDSCLGHAGSVWEYTLGEGKYTFIEECKNPQSVTILVKGPNRHTITQIKDAVRDGLRATKNVLDDKKVVPGAGAFEFMLNKRLLEFKQTVKGKVKFGVQAFADAMLAIPKTLTINAGLDAQDSLVKVQDAILRSSKNKNTKKFNRIKKFLSFVC